MVERLLLKNMSIPYGVLHDQKLLCVKQENGRLIFTFEIEIFENNYIGEWYLKYKDFNRCDMIVKLGSEDDDEYHFLTAVDSHNNFQGLLIDKHEFLNFANDAKVTFVDCHANGYSFTVNFDINSCNSQKFKKYSMCNIEIYTDKSVSFKWYNK